MANKKTTAEAGIAIQKAAQNKAKVAADTAQRNIESMTLKAQDVRLRATSSRTPPGT